MQFCIGYIRHCPVRASAKKFQFPSLYYMGSSKVANDFQARRIFSQIEVEALVDAVAARKDVIFGAFGTRGTQNAIFWLSA